MKARWKAALPTVVLFIFGCGGPGGPTATGDAQVLEFGASSSGSATWPDTKSELTSPATRPQWPTVQAPSESPDATAPAWPSSSALSSVPTVTSAEPDDPVPASSAPVRPDSAPPGPIPSLSLADVAVVGDSLTRSAIGEITTDLERLGVRSVVVDAIDGRRMVNEVSVRPGGLSAIDILQSAHDGSRGERVSQSSIELGSSATSDQIDIWVVALGTNDVGAQATGEELDRDIELILDEIGQDQTVIWLNVFIQQRRDASVDFGRRLEREAATRPWLHLVDWFTSAQQPELLLPDGVHLTRDGKARFASDIANAVANVVQVPNA